MESRGFHLLFYTHNVNFLFGLRRVETLDKGQLWYEGFRCKCGFYIEAGCLKEGELELSYIKEDRYKNGHLRFVDFQTNHDRSGNFANGAFMGAGWWDQGGRWYEYGLADLEESDQEYFKKLGYVEKGGTTITSGDQTRYWKKLILPKFEKCEYLSNLAFIST